MAKDAPYSDAATLGYSARDVAQTQGRTAIAVAGIEASSGIIREMFSAAKANPLIGILAALVTVDVLNRTGVIRDGTYMVLLRIVESFAIVSVAAEGLTTVEDLLSSIDPFKVGAGASPAATDVLTPVPTTLVESKGGSAPDPSAGVAPLASLLPAVKSAIPAGALL